MNQEPAIDRWRLFFLWVLATTVSNSCGTAAASIIFSPIRLQDGFADFSMVGYGLGQVFAGLCIGAAQWLVLKQYVLNAGWWVLATVAGYVVYTGIFLLNYQANGLTDTFLSFLWPRLFGLLALGLLQLLVLRKYVYRAYLWILAPSLVTLLFTGVTVLGQQNDALMPILSSSLLANIFHGSITGIVLVWLFGRPRPGQLAHGDTPQNTEEYDDSSAI